MTDHDLTPDELPDDDPTLAAAGARLRTSVAPVTMAGVERAALRRRLRRMGGLAAAGVAVALVGGVVAGRQTAPDTTASSRAATAMPTSDEVEELLAGLDDQPIDPSQVQLVASVSTYADCDALIGDLRQVGAAHVGSQGFGGGGWGPGGMFYRGWETGEVGAATRAGADMDFAASPQMNAASDEALSASGSGETLGTNVQVEGVDELDGVKAEGDFVYDLDRKGNLRITDANALEVVGSVGLIPEGAEDAGEGGGEPGRYASVSELLVADGKVAVIGSETEISPPVEGDPSATQAATTYMTVSFVDATDPAAPTITDRVRIEGSMVAARLVGGEIRLVTTSHIADLGFVMPTTPASVPIALDQNRRIVASSTAADWIPDWQRDGESAQPLVPCERVYVPDTFAGVAMTSMVTFPLASGTFDPAGTSLVAPGTTLYAGLDKVAISSEVWVDPIDREGLDVDDWQTAIHEFSFGDAASDADGEATGGEAPEAPGYEGSGIVDGSTVGQFAFGEIGESLAVVTTQGTPWSQGSDPVIDLNVLTPDGDGALDVTARVEDMADGKGAVNAVRFVSGRVLVSTGWSGREVAVIDVTDPAAPRRAGKLTVPGEVGYFHPLPDGRALMVASRSDTVGEGDNERHRSWVVAHLLDVSNADAPAILSTWERPWSSDSVAHDHHAFTYWPDRNLAMWGVMSDWQEGQPRANNAVVLGVGGADAGDAVTEVAVPEASRAPEVPAPCPVLEITDPEVRRAVGDATVLRCGTEVSQIDWPRYECWKADDASVARYAPGEEGTASFMVCNETGPPMVARVLVVAGRPYLYTDQTIERLNPETFASEAVAYHPGGRLGAW